MNTRNRYQGGHEADTAERPAAPTMSRSQGQLAGAYAPGAFFTFEGGLGACIAMPDADAQHWKPTLSPSTQDQILARLNEAVSSWFNRAYNCRPGDTRHPVLPQLCVDITLLNNDHTGVQPVDRGRFIFVAPTHMGYAPAPLTFVCNACGLFRSFRSVLEFNNSKSQLTARNCRANLGRRCQWRQLDIVFVHWSGNWEPVMPGKYDWDKNKQAVREPIDRCPHCHSEDFLLDTSSPSIGKWFFKCANPKCGFVDASGWMKNDRETIAALRDEFQGDRISEARMEPVSYRASSTHYALSEQFVLFDAESGDLLALLDPSKSSALEAFIAERFAYGQLRPSPAELERELKARGMGHLWDDYATKKKTAETFREQLKVAEQTAPDSVAGVMRDMLFQIEKDLADKVDGWFSGASPILRPVTQLPPHLTALLHARDLFSSRYDPFRLAVEHEALRRSKLTAPKSTGGRLPFVRFTHLDTDLAPQDDTRRKEQEDATALLLKQLGVETMGLIREFDLCRFTYGYSRMQAVPTFEKRQRVMPVRLNLFPTVQTDGGSKHPIYVVTQANEAFYVKLDELQVYRWLKALNIRDDFDWKPEDGPLGARLLERAMPFGRYLDQVAARSEASSYLYTYTLLHSFSHVLMKAIAEHSGLDLGSLGEYLFPADLAFVVYRNGTTMDLGNLSALWRNENERFLRHLLLPKTLLCNSGSLCDANPKNPGACPDCILVPETACIAMNQLLSRSVLRGGNAPREDGNHVSVRIPGYLQVVNNVV
ncbi:hypothetical protein [Rhodocyclus purpureus]|uniref:hypothetical protein n=1 Tax=Rhodocyclus purpureus TaxID=1067 RepID=UPI00191283F1|nr:hypothetical protein [Rhodocyclus purpureus]MBK5914477.1 hypothetical protein [Rhodocyclus purpureus]